MPTMQGPKRILRYLNIYGNVGLADKDKVQCMDKGEMNMVKAFFAFSSVLGMPSILNFDFSNK